MADLTQTPRRTAPRVALALVVLGAGSIVLGLALLVVLFVRNVMGYSDWPEGSGVPQDGASHVVSVEPGTTFQVWVYGVYDTADCAASDARTGDPVPLRATSGEATRPGGAVPYVARLSGTADSGRLEVTCARTAPDDRVFVDDLNGPVVVDFLGPLWPAPVGAAFMGAGLILAAGVAHSRRRS